MDNTNNLPVLWYYFSINENNLLNLGRYVEICDANMNCCSVEITRSILDIGSEVEYLFKRICQTQSMSESNISDYKKCLLTIKSNITQCAVQVKGVSIQTNSIIYPFKEWTNPNSGLTCWQNYSKIKHDKYILNTPSVANLRTLIELFGIYEILLALYTDIVSNDKCIPTSYFYRLLFPLKLDNSGFGSMLNFNMWFGIT